MIRDLTRSLISHAAIFRAKYHWRKSVLTTSQRAKKTAHVAASRLALFPERYVWANLPLSVFLKRHPSGFFNSRRMAL